VITKTMRAHSWFLTLAWIAGCVSVAAQSGRNEPRVAYVHPAGACCNTTLEVIAGGQGLQGMKEVIVSGTGVQARIVKAYRPVRNIDGDQRALLKWHIACRRAEIHGKPPPAKPKSPPPNPDGTPAPQISVPDMPLLDLLPTLDLRGIEHWMTLLQRRDRMQPNPQVGEMLRIEVKIAADAKPGMRELRLGGAQGLTNPLRFEIGAMPEIQEFEPNEPLTRSAEEEVAVSNAPCTFNGQIQSGDVDEFRFRAKRGANLVVRGRARALIPYLADAVPGWFQMVLKVSDANGREVAYGDDFRFDPDPVLCFKVPEDGEYHLEVRDSIYRGREDFVYRIHVGELSFVASAFPLGGTEGVPLAAEIRGWNLPGGSLPLDTSPGGSSIRTTRVTGKHGVSNDVPYAVDHLPEMLEAEPNNDAAKAQPASFPQVVNGRIEKPGDADVFRIEGRKGMELVIEVLARRLRSPLDAVVHVADDSGRVLAWNDDSMEKDGHLHLGDGLLTHHADPRVKVKLDEDGPVFIRIADTQTHGGREYAYRLRIGDVRPDFELRVTPSVVNAASGSHVPLRVHVLRNDGFDGEIHLALKDAPDGFSLSGGRIPAGATQARVTLTIPPRHTGGVVKPILTGTAGTGSSAITRTAVAADDTMQAFLWRHLMPADEWLVCVASGRGKQTPMEVDSALPLRITPGAAAEMRVNAPKWILDRRLEPELSEAPPGITVSEARKVPGGLAFDIKADASVKAGMETNLIIGIFSGDPQRGKPAKAAQRIAIAGLPAIPIIIVPPTTP
jgi:hypothetical protein